MTRVTLIALACPFAGFAAGFILTTLGVPL